MNAVVIEHVKVADYRSLAATRSPSPAMHTCGAHEKKSLCRLRTKPMLATTSLFGMWRDREDMADVDGYNRKLRRRRATTAMDRARKIRKS